MNGGRIHSPTANQVGRPPHVVESTDRSAEVTRVGQRNEHVFEMLPLIVLQPMGYSVVFLVSSFFFSSGEEERGGGECSCADACALARSTGGGWRPAAAARVGGGVGNQKTPSIPHIVLVTRDPGSKVQSVDSLTVRKGQAECPSPLRTRSPLWA